MCPDSWYDTSDKWAFVCTCTIHHVVEAQRKLWLLKKTLKLPNFWRLVQFNGLFIFMVFIEPHSVPVTSTYPQSGAGHQRVSTSLASTRRIINCSYLFNITGSSRIAATSFGWSVASHSGHDRSTCKKNVAFTQTDHMIEKAGNRSLTFAVSAFSNQQKPWQRMCGGGQKSP